MTPDQLTLLKDKIEVWRLPLGPIDLRDYQRRCADALEAALSELGDGGWQPIETAPKDGNWFLALQGGEIYPCEWLMKEPTGDGYALEQGWWDHFNESFEEPTHWMPLPPALSGEV